MKYRCINAFSVPKCDDDGYPSENLTMYIRKGSKWESTDDNYNNSEITLLHCTKNYWLGISKQTLDKNFEVME